MSFSLMISIANNFKKTRVKLELLADIKTLLLVQKRANGGICHSTNKYVKDNDKYMKD